ncbi:winged helix-turn-helix transcriptional regulator [Spirillospora sp. CA-255316]
MTDSTAALGAARVHNRRAVVELALSRGMLTRAEIASSAGLSKATVSRVVRELVEDGVLTEVPTAERTHSGRPTTPLILNVSLGRGYGFALGRDRLECAVADVRGVERRRWRRDLPQSAGAEEIVSALIAQLGSRAGATGTGIAVTLAVPAQVLASGELMASWVRPALGGVPLGALLRRALDADVEVVENTAAAVVGELGRGSARGARTAAYVLLDDEIRVGVRSADGLLARHSGALGGLGRLPLHDQGTVSHRLREAEETGDHATTERIVHFLCMVLISAHSPEAIVFSHAPGDGTALLSRVARRLSNEVPDPPRLAVAGVEDGALSGAILLSVDRLRSTLLGGRGPAGEAVDGEQ